MGGGHTQVGRPGHKETGALESALCMATIKPRRLTAAMMSLASCVYLGLPNPITVFQ